MSSKAVLLTPSGAPSSVAPQSTAVSRLRRVGRYDLITSIGHGGMADVFLGVLADGDDGRFQKLLAVKLIKADLSAEPEFIEMFMDEARVAGRLNHPNVIQTLEVGSDEGRNFLAMEYVDGQPLNRVTRALQRHEGFDLSARLTIVLRTLDGLGYAHQLTDYDGTPLGIVHRDISPGNILVGYDGQIKLTDFGIAKANDSSSQTRIGFLKGKTAYMAPEQARSSHVDRRADLYAAGVVLWELVAGRRMWGSAGQAEILTRAAAGDIPSLRQANPSVRAELEAICLRALATKREERYATAAELAADLEDFVRGHLQPKSEREVGRLVAEAFSEERARMREILDHQLSWRSRGLATLPHLAAVRDSRAAARPSSNEQAAPPSAPLRGVGSPAAPAALSPGAIAGTDLDGEPATLPRPPSTSGPDDPRRTRWRRTALVAGGLVMLAAGAVGLGLARQPSPAAVTRGVPAGASLGALAATGGPPASVSPGTSPTEITLGMSAVFSGPSRQLGENMKLGLETAFAQANAEGGVHGRKLRLVALDDGYEAAKVGTTMRSLLDERQVFAVIGNVGTPTSAVAAPIASKKKTIFFGAFTGAPVLRQDPPDRYVFNYRASYREETAASVRYLATVLKIPLDQIVVFAQEDSFGDAGYEGVLKAVRDLDRRQARDVLRVGYKRNTTDVEAAVDQIVKYHDKTRQVWRASQPEESVKVATHPVKAIIMVATYRAGAKFIQTLRSARHMAKPPLFLNVSFVGTEALADDLKGLDPSLCQGVYVTQVVPPFTSGATGVRRYREALAAYQPQAHPGFVSLEGYVVGSVFVEALKRTGPNVTTERLVDTLEQFHRVDLGFGAPLTFSLSEHQGSHKVWATRLDETCAPQPVDFD